MTKFLPEHGNNKIDQEEIGEQHIYSCNGLNRPILLWTPSFGRVVLPYSTVFGTVSWSTTWSSEYKQTQAYILLSCSL